MSQEVSRGGLATTPGRYSGGRGYGRLVLRIVGVVLFLLAVTMLALGASLWVRMLKAPSLVPSGMTLGMSLATLEAIGLLIGSVGLLRLKPWGAFLIGALLLVEVVQYVVNFAADRDILNVLFGGLCVGVILLLIALRGEFSPRRSTAG